MNVTIDLKNINGLQKVILKHAYDLYRHSKLCNQYRVLEYIKEHLEITWFYFIIPLHKQIISV